MEAFLAGAFASLTTDILVYPFDTLRTKLQVQTTHVSVWNQISTVIKETPSPKFRGFYKGLPAVLAFGMPANAIFYFVYEDSKKRTSELPDSISHLLSATIANFSATLIYCPMEVIKQRAMITPNGTASLVFKQILSGSKTGFYQGVFPALATWTPYMALYFLFYERLKVEASKQLGVKVEDLTMANHLGCGLISGMTAAALTNPLDVIKTRAQTSDVKRSVGDMVREEGWKVFGRGLQARMCWLGVSSALIITMYEQYKLFFEKVFGNDSSVKDL